MLKKELAVCQQRLQELASTVQAHIRGDKAAPVLDESSLEELLSRLEPKRSQEAVEVARQIASKSKTAKEQEVAEQEVAQAATRTYADHAHSTLMMEVPNVFHE